ncbi:Maf family protein [Enorma phocaeensis]|uniref:dTTP/UTP pyrophosphatase n=1 Tax=Enorma phocaeensis TaxID=1871019 RepID=A0A921ISE7_9ACTN|nr:Maf family protein [Enorma phocaeensis]HJG36369.1 Maf family protein [Enorma phocaeensis]
MILASQSPRRISLMREAGFDVRVIPADIDESMLENETPAALVERLARLKATYAAHKDAEPGELVVAADTVVALDGTVLGKPVDEQDAERMLARLSGKTHEVATGVCIARGGIPNTAESFVSTTRVTFYPLTESEIRAYVATGEPMDKAGSYGIQGIRGRLLVKGIKGDFYTVVGLPIAQVVRRLRAFGATAS